MTQTQWCLVGRNELLLLHSWRRRYPRENISRDERRRGYILLTRLNAKNGQLRRCLCSALDREGAGERVRRPRQPRRRRPGGGRQSRSQGSGIYHLPLWSLVRQKRSLGFLVGCCSDRPLDEESVETSGVIWPHFDHFRIC